MADEHRRPRGRVGIGDVEAAARRVIGRERKAEKPLLLAGSDGPDREEGGGQDGTVLENLDPGAVVRSALLHDEEARRVAGRRGDEQRIGEALGHPDRGQGSLGLGHAWSHEESEGEREERGSMEKRVLGDRSDVPPDDHGFLTKC